MKVSIITVCKNAQDTIEQTIKSVISQTYNNIERRRSVIRQKYGIKCHKYI